MFGMSGEVFEKYTSILLDFVRKPFIMEDNTVPKAHRYKFEVAKRVHRFAKSESSKVAV